jgi:branched-chain amino acid transport system ATP-binding protein
MSMLRITGLEVVYNRVVRALRDVSIAVDEGSIVALLGPNGAGKTTFLRAVTGLLPIHNGEITKGDISLNGMPLRGLAAHQIVRHGLVQVMEGRRIFAELSVEENLLAGTYNRQDSDWRNDLERTCQRFPILGQRRKQTAGLLSGGEQQMLAIARAWLARPRVLLLDEPSLGLSPQMTETVRQLIAEIRDAGVSILLVEQNAAMALGLADHGYILETGRIVLEGSAAELRNDADVREFYLGMGVAGRKSFREVKRYQRRRRWLS